MTVGIVFLLPSHLGITTFKIAAAVVSENTVPEETPAEPVQPEPIEEAKTAGPPLFGAQELVDLKDANPVRFSRDWDGWEVQVVGILAGINLRTRQIRLKVNESGTNYIIGIAGLVVA